MSPDEMKPEQDDEMMMDQIASECMDAIEKKDKQAFRDSFEILVVDILDKLSKEMEEEPLK